MIRIRLRSLSIPGGGGEEGAKVDVLRLSGPPVESYTIEAVIDATDDLGDGRSMTVTLGIQPMLSALEVLIYPRSKQLFANNKLATNNIKQTRNGH